MYTTEPYKHLFIEFNGVHEIVMMVIDIAELGVGHGLDWIGLDRMTDLIYNFDISRLNVHCV